jgi:hypothetical protein
MADALIIIPGLISASAVIAWAYRTGHDKGFMRGYAKAMARRSPDPPHKPSDVDGALDRLYNPRFVPVLPYGLERRHAFPGSPAFIEEPIDAKAP